MNPSNPSHPPAGAPPRAVDPVPRVRALVTRLAEWVAARAEAGAGGDCAGNPMAGFAGPLFASVLEGTGSAGRPPEDPAARTKAMGLLLLFATLASGDIAGTKAGDSGAEVGPELGPGLEPGQASRSGWARLAETLRAVLPGPAVLPGLVDHVGTLVRAFVATPSPARRHLATVLAEVAGHEEGHQRLADALGVVYHEIVPHETQKRLSTFYTGPRVAEFLASLVVRDANARVLDPACGSGTLLAAAARRERALGREGARAGPNEEEEEEVEKEDEDDGKAGENGKGKGKGSDDGDETGAGGALAGIEAMPLAALLARLNLELATAGTLPARVITGDAFQVPLAGAPYDVVIMNPPFTRGDALNAIRLGREASSSGTPNGGGTYKDALARRLPGHASAISRDMGLFAYFLLLADVHLRPGGRLGAILPASFLRVASAQGVRRLLLARYHVEVLAVRTDQSAFSESTALREVIVVARKRDPARVSAPPEPGTKADADAGTAGAGTAGTGASTALVRLHAFPETPRAIRGLARELVARTRARTASQSAGQASSRGAAPAYSVRFVSRATLAEALPNWYQPLFNYELWARARQLLGTGQDAPSKERATVPLHAVFPAGKIIRGVESPRFCGITDVAVVDPRFSASRDKWVFAGQAEIGQREAGGSTQGSREAAITIRLPAGDPGARPEVTIPGECLAPALRSFAGRARLAVDAVRDYLLVRPPPAGHAMRAAHAKLDRAGEEAWARWARHAARRAGRLFHVRRVDLSAPGSIHLGYHAGTAPRVATKLFWVFGVAGGLEALARRLDKPPREVAAVACLWFTGSPHLLQVLVNRIETRGAFIEIGKYTFADMHFPAPARLLAHWDRLVALATRLRDAPFPPLLAQLAGGHPARHALDALLLEVLGTVPRDQIPATVDALHEVLHAAIAGLKTMMRGD